LKKNKIHAFDLFLITIGTAIYAFGLIKFNLANDLCEGGVTGITLILKAIFQIDPAFSTIILNIPLFIVGGKILGKKSLVVTLFGTIILSVWIWIWQRIPIVISLQHDILIASLLAGIFAGVGSGLIYRAGGAAGGADITARIFEQKKGVSMGKSLLIFDICVLVLSLIYIDLKHMIYTLIASFVFSRLIEYVQNGGYTVRGMLIISNKSEEIASNVMALARGVTFLNGEGAYSHDPKQIIYVVLSPSEINEVKHMIERIDENAFISIINVHEVIGEGFTYSKSTDLLDP